MSNVFNELDRVIIKTNNAVGTIINVNDSNMYDIEKDGNEGHIYWNVSEDEIDHFDREIIDVNDLDDIKTFLQLSNRLHDAIIEKISFLNNELYISFDCHDRNVELWFEDDVAFNNSITTPIHDDFWWFRCGFFIDGKYKYLTSFDRMDHDLNKMDWFRAKNVRYSICYKEN